MRIMENGCADAVGTIPQNTDSISMKTMLEENRLRRLFLINVPDVVNIVGVFPLGNK